MINNIFWRTQINNIIGNGHWQTILPHYLTNYLIDKIKYERERIYTPDNDFIDLDWVNRNITDAPTLILFHGMEGNSDSHYARRIMHYLQTIGWRGVVAHARSCSGEINNTLNFYHGGMTDDIRFIIDMVKKITPHKLFTAGVSLGGNALLKFLGEGNPEAELVEAAIAISVPFDLEVTSHTLSKNIPGRLYAPYFLSTLLPKMKIYAEKFPEFRLRPHVKTIHEFNVEYITQIYKFKNALEYYQQSSSIFYLKKVNKPTLIIQAANDPMIPKETWPHKEHLSQTIHFFGLNSGGHAGFVGNNRNLRQAVLKLPRTMSQFYKKFLYS